jgi:hypothetical protein
MTPREPCRRFDQILEVGKQRRFPVDQGRTPGARPTNPINCRDRLRLAAQFLQSATNGAPCNAADPGNGRYSAPFRGQSLSRREQAAAALVQNGRRRGIAQLDRTFVNHLVILGV